MKGITPLIARIFLAVPFLVAGFGKIMDPVGAEQYMAASGMPLTKLFLAGAIILEIGGGLALLLGYKARPAAVALAFFVVIATLIFHNKLSNQLQMIMFMKNLAILGGLLFAAYSGPGPLSIDACYRTAGVMGGPT